MTPLVLASQSPRRRQLLTQAGFLFQVLPATGKEKAYKLAPRALVRKLAEDKALEVARKLKKAGKEARVLGSDTMVFYQRKRLGKPKSVADARRMLKGLSGKKHQVMTGVALASTSGGIASGVEVTDVWFRKLSDFEIEQYLATGEAMDKAGAYGIQGAAARFVKRIEGCYYNVVGLPMALTVEMLEG